MTALDLADWQAVAAKTAVPHEAFVDGDRVGALSGEVFTCANPATGEVLADVASCAAPDVDRAVAAARRSFEAGSWSQASPRQRGAVLTRIAALMDQYAEELAVLDSLDMGKRVVDAHQADLPFSADLFRFYGEAADKVAGEIAPTGPGVSAQITREALGVVAAVIPWNYPVDMLAWKAAPALAAGNSVVLKPAEQSPLSALRMAELMTEAGVPDGVFNVLPGFGETAGRALGLHPDVDVLAFTGSTEVGKAFLTYAGSSNMKQTWLECGGKSAAIVFADCPDLRRAAEAVCADIFFNAGEVCSAHSRLLVERSVLDEVLSHVREAATRYQPGDPLSPSSGMGALVDAAHTDRVLEHIDRARQHAELLCGGNRITIGSSDCFVEPTVFVHVDPASSLAQTEVFGPVLAVTPFDGEDEAVRLANSTPFGLAASFFTSDVSRVYRVSRRLVAGTVSVNTVDAFSVHTPFGGFKQSGFGRDLSLHALDKFTGLKTTWTAW